MDDFIILKFTMPAISLLSRFSFFNIISILATIICITNFTHAYTQCLDVQKTLLLQLKNELVTDDHYASHKRLVQWNQTDDCCSWNGVECDAAGHIIGLQLDQESISGGLNSSSSLFSLQYLEKLNLAWNDLNGTQIPKEIGNLTYLTHLNLSYAELGGQVPVEISLLSRLVSLDISGNRYMEPLNEHFNLTMLLKNLTGLKQLYLDGIDISIQGSEWCQVISSSLPHLEILSLGYCNLSGPPHPSLLHLRSLSFLRLDGYNNLTTVPSFFANFSSLTTVSLSYCSLQGSFPEVIFQVPTLQEFDLSFNYLLNGTFPRFPRRAFRSILLQYTGLSGSLPDDSFQNISMLSHIDLSYSNFSGPIPSTLANLTELMHVDLSHNSFTGSVPPFYASKNLIYIDFSFNKLSGSLSSNHFAALSKLVHIDLGYNSLSGNVPQSIFGLPLLERLMLNNNQFHGTLQLKMIPKLHHLYGLDLSYNNLSIDASKANLSTFPELRFLYLGSCNMYNFPDFLKRSNVTYLDLSDNRIAGEVPSWIWNLELQFLNLSHNLFVDLQKPYHIPIMLGVLDLHSNLFQGDLLLPIPVKDGNMTPILSSLYLANNNLSGPIPTSICNAVSLEVVDLSFNNLSGNIPPCLLENEDLKVLNLGRNNISGDIPDKFSASCYLEALDLSNNNIGGNIPKSLANCKRLEALNVGNNFINDSFPCMLPTSLRLLVLRSNRFHGEVRCHKSWPNIQIIDISSNNFNGYLYSINFSSWRGMMLGSQRQLMRNNLGYVVGERNRYYINEVTLTIKGLEREIVKIWTEYTAIDFSCNNFQGKIPDPIGDLSSLYLLNISHNALTGTIPKSFGSLTQLGSLDLSVNQLIGVIPTELARLNFLSFLNLSYNKLFGMIPVGSQIQTFPVDSFKGNTGLCGLPLNISCNRSDEDYLPPQEEAKISEIEWDYVSAALGFVVGLGSIVWSLLCCQNLRKTYFDKVDKVLENIFNHQDGIRRRKRALRNQVRRP